ncbi:MAG: extracellular solute-binding protein [Propionibacteriaceae bacterium]|nr:extracellular solute-binding protein [Propionibacteriaceae bacterium]
MRHTKPALATVLVIALATLAGCSGSSGGGTSTSSAGNSSITFLTFYDDTAVQGLISTYCQSHPNVTIQHQTVPFADLNQTIETRLANKSTDVDLYMADQPRISSLVNSGYLADVTGTVSDTSIWLKSALDASTVDGKLMAYPVNTSTSVLYYNADLLNAAGITPPSANPNDRLTWDQVVAEAKQAQAAGAQWGLQFDQVSRYYQLQPLIESAGGGSGLTGTGNLTPDVTNDGWTAAMTFYQSLYTDGVSEKGITPDQTPDSFASGKVAFYIGGTHLAAQWDSDNVSFKWGIAAHPYVAGGQPVTPTGAWSIGINPNSKNIGAAEDFAKWITTTAEGQQAFLNVDAGIPAQTSQLDSYLSSGIWGQGPSGSTPGDLVKYELQNTAVIRPVSIGYIQFEAITGTTFEDIRNGISVTSALQSAQQQLTDAFAHLS